MKRLLMLGALLLSNSVVLSAEPSQPAADPTADTVRARELVRDLADPKFKVRENAAREIKKLGRHAKPALLEGMKSTDPEVWSRCTQLLPEVLALDLKARVEAFLADTEGKQKHELPMMERFQKFAGNEPPARKLYAEMVKSNAEFLEACELEPKKAGEKYNLRGMELFQQLNQPWSGKGARPQLNVPDLAAVLLIGADPEVGKVQANPNFAPVSNLIWQQPFQNALRSGEQAVPFRKLFFAWAEQRNDANSISQVLSVIQGINMKEGLDFASKVMKMKDTQMWTRAQAMTCVGKMGDKDHVPAFEALFDDKTQVTVIQWNNVNITTQMNDIALAMAVHLSGQKHKEYGFDALQTQPEMLWAYHYLGFSTEEKRTAAFKKYQDWSAAQKKK